MMPTSDLTQIWFNSITCTSGWWQSRIFVAIVVVPCIGVEHTITIVPENRWIIQPLWFRWFVFDLVLSFVVSLLRWRIWTHFQYILDYALQEVIQSEWLWLYGSMEYRLYGAVCESFYNPETPSTCCDYNWTGVGVLLLRTISIDIASAHGRMRPYVHHAPYNLVQVQGTTTIHSQAMLTRRFRNIFFSTFKSRPT